MGGIWTTAKKKGAAPFKGKPLKKNGGGFCEKYPGAGGVIFRGGVLGPSKTLGGNLVGNIYLILARTFKNARGIFFS